MKIITMLTPLTKAEIKKFWVEDRDVQVRNSDLMLKRLADACASYGMPVANEFEVRPLEVARLRQIKVNRQAAYENK